MVAASFRIRRSKNDLLRKIYLIHLRSDGMPGAIPIFNNNYDGDYSPQAGLR
jgi:hypothetical protein